jgi:hypothetical protein
MRRVLWSTVLSIDACLTVAVALGVDTNGASTQEERIVMTRESGAQRLSPRSRI